MFLINESVKLSFQNKGYRDVNVLQFTVRIEIKINQEKMLHIVFLVLKKNFS